MDTRQLSELDVHKVDPDFFQSDEGREFLAGYGPIKVEQGPNKLAFLLFGLGVALFGSFLYMVNTDIDMSAPVFMVTMLGGLFGLMIGGIWAFAEVTTKPIIREATHVVPGVVSSKKVLRRVGTWQVHAQFTSPETGKTRKTMFMLAPKDRDAVTVGRTRVAVIYASKFDKGLVL